MAKHIANRTYLVQQDKKEYNFTSKQVSTPLLPISGNVFTYLLLNKLTQIQNATQIGSGNNEYFLAKSINIQKEKVINKQRLEVFLNRSNVKKTEVVNYKKIGYNKYSIYTMLSLMKKDRFFLNDKFYQDVLGRRAFNVYKGGIFGYEKNLKLLKKYNEYFERQIFLMSEKVDTFFEKNTALVTGRMGDPTITTFKRTTPVMGWKWNTGRRAYLEIWKRIRAKQIKLTRANLETFYFDDKSMLNVEDLSLMALKNLRDYELYFGMQFYKKEIKRYLSRAGVGRSMYLSVFSRNATRFNFLKDAGYKKTSSNYKSGVATNYGLLRALYTKKHFPKTSLEAANSYFNFSFFNTEVGAETINETIANAGKFNRKKENKKTVKIKFLANNGKLLATNTASLLEIKKIKANKVIKTTKKYAITPKTQQTKKVDFASLCRRNGLIKRKFGIKLKFKTSIRKINVKKNEKNKSTILRSLVEKLNKQQIKSLVLGTLFRGFSKINYNFLASTRGTSASLNKKILNFKLHATKNWKKKGMANHTNNDEFVIRAPIYVLKRMRFGFRKEQVPTLNIRKKLSRVKANRPVGLDLGETKITISSLKFLRRTKERWETSVSGLLGLKLFAFKNERILLKNMFKKQNAVNANLKNSISYIEDLAELKKVYTELFDKNIIMGEKTFKESYHVKVTSLFIKSTLRDFEMAKTASLLTVVPLSRANRVQWVHDYRAKPKRRKLKKVDYAKYTLRKLYKYGYSPRINVRRGRRTMDNKTKLKIIYGTSNARKIITKKLGEGSNLLVGAASLRKVKNKIGKLTIFELGINYNNAIAQKLVKNRVENNLKLNLKFKENNIFVVKNNKVEKTLDIKKNLIKENIGVDYSFQQSFSNNFFLRKQNVRSGQVAVHKAKLKCKNLNLVKKYLGLAMFDYARTATVMFKQNISRFYSKKTKINFTKKSFKFKTIKQKIELTQAPYKVYPKYLVKKQNLELLNKKLGITENLNLLDITEHDHSSIWGRRDYLFNYEKKNKSFEHKLDFGTKLRENKNNIETEFKQITNFGELLVYADGKTFNRKYGEMCKEEIMSLSELLDKKRYSIRNKLNSSETFNWFSLNPNRYKYENITALEKRSILDDNVARHLWQQKSKPGKKRVKMWEHDFGAAMSNTLKRLGKYSKHTNKSVLRTYCFRKLSFLNRRNIKRIRRVIRKWVMVRKTLKLKFKMNPVQRLKSRVGSGNQPVRLTGTPRISLAYPSAIFLKNLANKYRREKANLFGVISNDIEHDYYRGIVSLMKTVGRQFFKQNYRLQIKKKVFGDASRKVHRALPFVERSLRSKYTRKLYKQFGMRRFPTFWYRIARKKFPLKNKKKEWAIKIPLAERFIFPFDRQVWNTTYDSSIIYHKNIGWLNFSRKIRRLKRIKKFYRYGREHDGSTVEIPFTVPHGAYTPRSRNAVYDKYFKFNKNGLTLFRNEFGVETKKRKRPLSVQGVTAFYKEYGIRRLRTLNYEYMAYRDSLADWHTRLKPITGYSGLKTYYTYNSYIMQVNTEIKTRRYKTLFSNFAFAFKLNKTDFTKNIINFNFTQLARDIFSVTAKNVACSGVKNLFNFKYQYARVARALNSKYRYFGYSRFTGQQVLFRGKQIVESLVQTNKDFNGDALNVLSNPILKLKNDSRFVETYTKFRFRNKVLRSSQNLQLRFMDEEARVGLKSFAAKNIVW